jgi:hypothetical protein
VITPPDPLGLAGIELVSHRSPRGKGQPARLR